MKSPSHTPVVTVLLLLAMLSVACSSNSLAQTQAATTPIPLPTGKVGWTFNVDSGQPTLADNQIYFVGYDTGILYVLDAKTGEKRWEFDPKTSSFGAWSPIVTDDTVYFRPTASKTLIAVDLNTHQEKWRYELKYPAKSPAVQGDTVYIVDVNEVVALDSATGKEKQSYLYGPWSHSPPTVDGETLYISSSGMRWVVGSSHGNTVVQAFDLRSGEPRWGYGVYGSILDTPTLKDGAVFVGSWDEHLYVIDAETGHRKWYFTAQGNVNKPVVDNGVVYITSFRNRVYALDAETGKELWNYETDETIGRPPVVVGDSVFVMDNKDKLYILDNETGNQKWEYQQNMCNPFVFATGMIMLSCPDDMKTLQ